MTSSEFRLRTDRLTKTFPSGQAAALLRERLARALFRTEARHEPIRALTEVSFRAKAGEAIALIGGNGAGKTTLLRILAGTTAPTAGRAHLRGRMAALLEASAPFAWELTVRENIFLAGAIQGLSRREIRRRLDRIVETFGYATSLERPYHQLSTGMQARLGAAVTLNLDWEILLLDETLSVADAGFRERCLGSLRDGLRDGRTVILVSHSTETLRALCTRGLWLREGRLAADGDLETVLAEAGLR